jgi:plasmid stability protein
MAQLIVRNLEDEIVKRLRLRAAQNGRSVEAEHREILREALLGGPRRRSFKEYLLTMPNVGSDEDFRRNPSKFRKIRL